MAENQEERNKKVEAEMQDPVKVSLLVYLRMRNAANN
jgi:hypothetical protein